MSLLGRFANLFRNRKLDRDLEDELRSHVEMRAEENMAEGMSPEEARIDAARRFGNEALIKETARTQDTLNWLETIWQDLRYALRVMRKNPGFSAMAVLIVAVGIGASTTLFSVADTALRKGRYANDDRWVVVTAFFPRQNLRVFNFSVPEYLELRAQTQTFEKVATLAGFNGTLLVDNAPERIECTRASADAIPMTEIAPLLGRTFLPEEDQPGGARVAILSYELWQRRFHGNQQVLGTPIRIDDEKYTVIGVMPPRYGLWGGELWVPYQLDLAVNNRSDRQVRVAALIRKDLTATQANARLQELAQRMEKEHSGTNRCQQGEDERVGIDPNAFQQRKVEGMKMCQFPRAGHGENEPQYSTAAGERHALGQVQFQLGRIGSSSEQTLAHVLDDLD